MRHATTRDVVLSGGSKARVRGAHRDEEPLHSEGNHPESKISYFYPLFEDLLIIGGSKCVVHGIGSFGAFGAGLNGNRCRAIHRLYNGKPLTCPNERTSYECTSITQQIKNYEGKFLFDSKVEEEDLISSQRCNGIDMEGDASISRTHVDTDLYSGVGAGAGSAGAVVRFDSVAGAGVREGAVVRAGADSSFGAGAGASAGSSFSAGTDTGAGTGEARIRIDFYKEQS